MSTLHKRKKTTSTLRQRIIHQMPNILTEMEIERRGQPLNGDADFRWKIIRNILEIAKLEAMSPSQAQRAFARVDKDVRRLERSIAKLPLSSRHLVEVRGLNVVGELIAAETDSTAGTGSTAAKRKLRAAELACDLILDYGSVVPTLTKDGNYIRLAGLLYFVATEKTSNLESFCSKHYADLKREGFDFYSHRRGPRRSPDGFPDHLPEYYEARRLQRVEVIKGWPPLEQVVDEILGPRADLATRKS